MNTKVIFGITIAALVVVGVAATASAKSPPRGSGGGGGGSGGGGGGSGGGSGGGGFKSRGLPGGGYAFGSILDQHVPGDFKGNGNKILISNDCEVVLVGAGFLPRPFYDGILALDPPDGTLATSLEIPNNTAMGFISYLTDTEGVDSGEAIIARILAELDPPCLGQPSASWPEAMRNFVLWLRDRVEWLVKEGYVSIVDPWFEIPQGGS